MSLEITAVRPSSMCRRDEHAICKQSGAMCGCHCHGRPILSLSLHERVEPPAPKAAPPAPKVTPLRARRSRPSPRPRYVEPVEHIRPWITKEEAECCTSKRDSLGRLPIGYCGPDCIRRPR
jgi:hypothetical protein